MKIKTFKFFWTTHKWTGISLALIFVMISVTGFLLLLKKQYEWIQPPTQRGGEITEISEFITTEAMFEAVFAHGHEDFKNLDDIDRVDFRPGKSVFKVRSNHNWSELQVDAKTGEVLSVDWRPSDMIEQIHDGSFFADWVHDWVMPIVAIGLLFLTFSGIWLWLEPIVRRKKRRREGAARARASRAATAPPPQS